MTSPSRLTTSQPEPLGDFEDWLPLRGRWLRYFGRVMFGLVLVMLFNAVQPYSRRTSKGQRGAASSQIANFKTAIELYRVDHNGKPPVDLTCLVSLPNGAHPKERLRWKGPYLNDVTTIPADPWGNPYIYTVPGSKGQRYELTSLGEDGVP
ncbi:MAG: ral secretion pathway protein, partial [Armatimonadetes bacterium]|nr:ral secretion pathway protein [Armatimonadota bacterium]